MLNSSRVWSIDARLRRIERRLFEDEAVHFVVGKCAQRGEIVVNVHLIVLFLLMSFRRCVASNVGLHRLVEGGNVSQVKGRRRAVQWIGRIGVEQ